MTKSTHQPDVSTKRESVDTSSAAQTLKPFESSLDPSDVFARVTDEMVRRAEESHAARKAIMEKHAPIDPVPLAAAIAALERIYAAAIALTHFIQCDAGWRQAGAADCQCAPCVAARGFVDAVASYEKTKAGET